MKKRLMALFLGLMMTIQILPQTVAAAEIKNGSVRMETVGVQYESNGIGQVKKAKCTSYTNKSINISWNQVPGVSGYEILRANARDGVYKNIMNVAAGNGAFCNRSVKMGTEYYYKIRAYVKRGNKIAVGKASKILAAHTRMNKSVTGKTRVNANVRKTAGINGKYRATLKQGTTVSILCSTCDKGNVKWYKIKTKSGGKKVSGYMRADLIK